MKIERIHTGQAKITKESDTKRVPVAVRLSHQLQLNQIWERYTRDIIDADTALTSVLAIMRKNANYEHYYQYVAEAGWQPKNVDLSSGNTKGGTLYGLADPEEHLLKIDMLALKNPGWVTNCIETIAEETRHAWQIIELDTYGKYTLGDRNNPSDRTEPIKYKTHRKIDVKLNHDVFDNYDNHPEEKDAKIFAQWMSFEIWLEGRKRYD